MEWLKTTKHKAVHKYCKDSQLSITRHHCQTSTEQCTHCSSKFDAFFSQNIVLSTFSFSIQNQKQ